MKQKIGFYNESKLEEVETLQIENMKLIRHEWRHNRTILFECQGKKDQITEDGRRTTEKRKRG